MATEPGTSPYQMLDGLTEQQYADLRDDIAECGILQPIAVDEHGVVLDGHHRQRIARELGMDYPTYQPLPAGASEAQKLDTSLKLNLMGRQQTGEQKRELIKRYLQRRPEAADAHIARIVGCSHSTVGLVRRELEGSCQIDRMATRVGERAGKPYVQKVKAKPDPEAVAARQAELARVRTVNRAKRDGERAEAEALTQANMAPGGVMQSPRRVRAVAGPAVGPPTVAAPSPVGAPVGGWQPLPPTTPLFGWGGGCLTAHHRFKSPGGEAL